MSFLMFKFRFKKTILLLQGLLLLSFDLSAANLEIKIFSASWCGPCQALRKITAPLSQKLKLTFNSPDGSVEQLIKISEVDASEIEDAAKLGKLSSSYPELQLFYNDRFLGLIAARPDPRLESSDASVDFFNRLRDEIRKTLGKKLISTIVEKEKSKNKSRSIAERIDSNLGLLLAGTGWDASENPVFIGNSIQATKKTLTSYFGVSEKKINTFYGMGENASKTPDASIQLTKNSELSATFVEGVGSNAQFSVENLETFFNVIEQKKSKRALMLIVGHGLRNGLKTWESAELVSPRLVEGFHRKNIAATNFVMVSGACYSGAFARSASCGFFAARPDTLADGCSPLAATGQAKDYVKAFFDGASSGSSADYNGDGKVSFIESHFYAMVFGSKFDAPYTSFDGLADRVFNSNPKLLPKMISLDDLNTLAQTYASDEERFALSVLYAGSGAADGTTFQTRPLEHFVLKPFSIAIENADGQVVLANFYPFGSDETTAPMFGVSTGTAALNGSIDLSTFSIPESLLPYMQLHGMGKRANFRRGLSQLIRRLYFKKILSTMTNEVETKSEALLKEAQEILGCENQEIKAFLQTQ